MSCVGGQALLQLTQANRNKMQQKLCLTTMITNLKTRLFDFDRPLHAISTLQITHLENFFKNYIPYVSFRLFFKVEAI